MNTHSLNPAGMPTIGSFESYRLYVKNISSRSEEEEIYLVNKFKQENCIQSAQRLVISQLKTVLHLATLSAISRPGEFRDYFVRKVKEGKNKMLVINAIRNKLIHRVFACVRDQRKYFKKDLTFA